MSETQLKPPLPHTGWKIFFWFHVLLALILSALLLILLLAPDRVILSAQTEEVSILFSQMKKDILSEQSIFAFILDYILFIFLTLGLYGYAYRKKIWIEKFWIFVFGAHIISLIYLTFTLKTDDMDMSEPISLIFALILTPLLTFFELLALYRYAFKSPHIWNTSQKDEMNS